MTTFEELAKECNVEITTDRNGLYTKHAKALAQMATEIIISDDESIFKMSWEEQKELIKEKFFKTFSYKA